MAETLKIGARVMLIISTINLFYLITMSGYNGGKVKVSFSIETLILQIMLIVFLAYISFYKKDEIK